MMVLEDSIYQGKTPQTPPSGDPLRGNLPLVAAKQDLIYKYSSVEGMCIYNTIRAFNIRNTNNLA